MKQVLVIAIISFTVFLPGNSMNRSTPQVKRIVTQETETYDYKSLKDSIISCANAVEKSKKVISLNEPYLKNLDKKLQQKQNKKKSN